MLVLVVSIVDMMYIAKDMMHTVGDMMYTVGEMMYTVEDMIYTVVEKRCIMKIIRRNIMNKSRMEHTALQFMSPIVKLMKNLFVKQSTIPTVSKFRIKNATLTRSNHVLKLKIKSAMKNIMNFALMQKILIVRFLMKKNVLKFWIRSVTP